MHVKRGEMLQGVPLRFSPFRSSILVAPSTQAPMITLCQKIDEFPGAFFLCLCLWYVLLGGGRTQDSPQNDSE